METIKGDLELKENTTFNKSIKVEGNVIGKYDLIVNGNFNGLKRFVRSVGNEDIKR